MVDISIVHGVYNGFIKQIITGWHHPAGKISFLSGASGVHAASCRAPIANDESWCIPCWFNGHVSWKPSTQIYGVPAHCPAKKSGHPTNEMPSGAFKKHRVLMFCMRIGYLQFQWIESTCSFLKLAWLKGPHFHALLPLVILKPPQKQRNQTDPYFSTPLVQGGAHVLWKSLSNQLLSSV